MTMKTPKITQDDLLDVMIENAEDAADVAFVMPVHPSERDRFEGAISDVARFWQRVADDPRADPNMAREAKRLLDRIRVVRRGLAQPKAPAWLDEVLYEAVMLGDESAAAADRLLHTPAIVRLARAKVKNRAASHEATKTRRHDAARRHEEIRRAIAVYRRAHPTDSIKRMAKHLAAEHNLAANDGFSESTIRRVARKMVSHQ
jgi:hypothetical protein